MFILTNNRGFSMNRMNRRTYALLLTVAVAATNAAYGMEVEMVETVSTEQQNEVAVCTAWYKTRQAKIAAAVATCALVGYAIAVRMDKVSSPAALLAGLFTKKSKQPIEVIVTQKKVTTTTGDSSTPAPSTNTVSADKTKTDSSGVAPKQDNVPAETAKSNDQTLVGFFNGVSKKTSELKNTAVQSVYELNPAMFDKASELKNAVSQKVYELNPAMFDKLPKKFSEFKSAVKAHWHAE